LKERNKSVSENKKKMGSVFLLLFFKNPKQMELKKMHPHKEAARL